MKEEEQYVVSPQSVREAEGPMYESLAGCSGNSTKCVVEVFPEHSPLCLVTLALT